MIMNPNAGGGGGEVDIVYGVLADGEGVEVTSNSTIITLPSNIKKLTGLNIAYTANGSYNLVCYPASVRPNNPSPNENDVWTFDIIKSAGVLAGSAAGISVSGNKVTINTDIIFDSINAVAYTYIPE